MPKLTFALALASLAFSGAALADDARQAPPPPGQSVTGPASQRTDGDAATVGSDSSSKPPSLPAESQPEKADGRNNGESDTPKEETPGVKSSTTNSF